MTAISDLQLIPRPTGSLVVSNDDFSREAARRLTSLFGIKFGNHQFGLLSSPAGLGWERIGSYTINDRQVIVGIEIEITGTGATISLDIDRLFSGGRTEREREADICKSFLAAGCKLPAVVSEVAEAGGHLVVVWEEHGFEPAKLLNGLFTEFRNSFSSPSGAGEYIYDLVNRYGSIFKPDPYYRESDSAVYSANSDDGTVTIPGHRRPGDDMAPQSTQAEIRHAWREQLSAWLRERVPRELLAG